MGWPTWGFRMPLVWMVLEESRSLTFRLSKLPSQGTGHETDPKSVVELPLYSVFFYREAGAGYRSSNPCAGSRSVFARAEYFTSR